MLLVILAVSKLGKGFVVIVSVLIGIVVGAITAAALGRMHFDSVGSAPAFGIVIPFQFGLPDFSLGPIFTCASSWLS
jgi:NCS2 family nucleobase:cation symporter-2